MFDDIVKPVYIIMLFYIIIFVYITIITYLPYFGVYAERWMSN